MLESLKALITSTITQSQKTSFVTSASMKPPARKLKSWNIKLKVRKLKMYENKDRQLEENQRKDDKHNG